jgi:CBS domain containing-hemolysin-like protein
MASVLVAASAASTALYTVPIVGVELGQTGVIMLGALMILMLLVGSGFLSSSEIALFSLPAHQIDAMAEEGKRGVRAVRSLNEDPHRLLVTILVGNHMVDITMSSIPTTLVGFYFDASTAVIVSSPGTTSMVRISGESAPRSSAVENTELHARHVARGLTVVEKMLWPPIVLFYYLTGLVNGITGGSASIESTYVTRDEIRNMTRTGEREGVLDEEERQMLRRALRFTDATAKEVMPPRLDVAAVPGDATVDEAIETCIRSGHARLPASDGSLDDVIGVFDVRELEDSGYDSFPDLGVADVVNPTLHVPESKNVDELLSEMRENRMHVVIVVDEFGAIEGLITMEDVTEETVGEILVGGEDHPIELVGDTEVPVRGEVNIEEVNEALDTALSEGEEFGHGNVTPRAEQVENTRIRKVLVIVDPETAAPIEEESVADEGGPG